MTSRRSTLERAGRRRLRKSPVASAKLSLAPAGTVQDVGTCWPLCRCSNSPCHVRDLGQAEKERLHKEDDATGVN